VRPAPRSGPGVEGRRACARALRPAPGRATPLDARGGTRAEERVRLVILAAWSGEMGAGDGPSTTMRPPGWASASCKSAWPTPSTPTSSPLRSRFHGPNGASKKGFRLPSPRRPAVGFMGTMDRGVRGPRDPLAAEASV